MGLDDTGLASVTLKRIVKKISLSNLLSILLIRLRRKSQYGRSRPFIPIFGLFNKRRIDVSFRQLYKVRIINNLWPFINGFSNYGR